MKAIKDMPEHSRPREKRGGGANRRGTRCDVFIQGRTRAMASTSVRGSPRALLNSRATAPVRARAGYKIPGNVTKEAPGVIALNYGLGCGRIPPGARMKIEELIDRNPEKMSGTPVFSGTRVPITHLFDHLEGGESLEEFLDQFPTVTRDQAVAVLSASRESLLSVPTSTQARIESMRQAVEDHLFMADLTATMEDFKDVIHFGESA